MNNASVKILCFLKRFRVAICPNPEMERELLPGMEPSNSTPEELFGPLGTVGAVCVDRYGNLAAATSTGGKTNKLSGRIGDTPVLGAGTYAEPGIAAVSATGDGDVFLRYVLAYDIIARVKYAGTNLRIAADEAIQAVKRAHGEGGVIAVGADGTIAMPMNCASMYRGYIREDGHPVCAIFRDDGE